MNPFAETWVRSIKRECLEQFLVFGERHLTYLIQEYLRYYHEERPHQGLENRPPNSAEPPTEILQVEPGQVICRERLGGVLKHYERRAA